MRKGLQYNWSFGDGASRNWSRDPLANHTYVKPGKYEVRLAVRDDDGAEGAATTNVTVTNVPPSAGAMADRTAMEDESIDFSGTGSDTATDRARLQYKWDFGDGNGTAYGSSAKTTHAYSQKGIYTAVLSVRDPNLAVTTAPVNITVLNPAPSCEIMPEFRDRTFKEDQSVVFDGTGSDNPSDLWSLLYQWDFGDGNVTEWSPVTPASHTYTKRGDYAVKMTVKDDDGDTGDATARLVINNPEPVPEILTDDQTVKEDQEVEFLGTATDTPSDQDILIYYWNFGDGCYSAPSPSPEAVHAYTTAGTYKVTMWARDDEGNGSKAADPVYITVENAPPVASASASKKNVDEDAAVSFTAKASRDTPSDMASLRYFWDFGDKTDEEEGMNVTHAYAKSGTYTVKLTVTDGDGASSTDSSLRIKVANLPPTATASADLKTAKTGQAIKFTGTGNDTPSDLSQLKYAWTFGDETTALGKDASHAYTTAGRYTVTLSVSDPEGDKATATVTVEITPAKAPEPPKSGTNWALVGGGVAAALVVVVVVAVLLMRRK
jgi:PKD repeat protein